MESEHNREATQLFAGGYNCSQSVLTIYANKYGINPELASRIATGFGGGIGRSGNICGAVSGAILAIGLAHGTSYSDESDNKEMCYSLSKQFLQRFTKKFGSIQCSSLLGFNLAIPEEREEAKRQDAFNIVCPVLIAGAVDILDDIL